MNSKRRCLTVLHGSPVDGVPVFPLLMHLAADRVGVSYQRCATDGVSLAAAQVNVRRRFGVDAITACSDAFRIVADLGGKMAYPEDKPPHLSQPLVCSPGDNGRLPGKASRTDRPRLLLTGNDL